MKPNTAIPLVDLPASHGELEEEILSIVRFALRTGEFVGGSMVEEFEHDFAQFCETEFCVGVGSGTDALRLALIAAGINHGDIVVTVPNTFIATAEAVSQAGAVPAFVDVDERTQTMDPEKLREFLEKRCYLDAQTGRAVHAKLRRPISAVIPVHLFGQMANLDPILDLAERYRMRVFEDACQAHGAQFYSKKERRWKKAGSLGVAAAFSFYPGKNLGACGEGGAVTTNDREIAQKIRMLRDHGQAQKYFHELEGYNARLDAVQAGILRIKLGHLAKWNRERRARALQYNDLLAPLGERVVLPFDAPWSRSVYHLYVIRAANRNLLKSHLAEAQISTGIHYPIPLHLQNAYRYLGYSAGDFPVAERAAGEILSLPLYPQLTPQQQGFIAQKVTEFFSPVVAAPSRLAVPTSAA